MSPPVVTEAELRYRFQSHTPHLNNFGFDGTRYRTQGLMELLRNSENESFVIMQLLFKLSVLPLSRQITCLAGVCVCICVCLCGRCL